MKKKAVASLSRLDYATSKRVRAREPLDLEISTPIQLRVSMDPAYAALLLDQLRSGAAQKMKRGECSSISVDCPVEIVLDAKTLKSLIAALEKGIA